MGIDTLVMRSRYSVYRQAIYFIIFLFVVCAPKSTCAQQSSYDSIYHIKSYAERSLRFNTMVYAPLYKQTREVFYREMAKVENRAKAEHDYAIELEVILGRRRYEKDNHQMNLAERIPAMERLLAGIDRKKYKEYAVLIMVDLGNNYSRKKYDYSLGFEHYINALDLLEDMSSKDFPDKKDLVVNIANRYYQLGDNVKAKELLLSADSLPAYRLKTTAYNNSNTLGLIYRSTGNYDSAILYFNKAYRLAIATKDTAWQSITKGNIGIVYYMKKDYAKAIPLLYEDIDGCIKSGPKGYDNGIHSLLILADIHLNMDSIAAVRKDIDLAKRYLGFVYDTVRRLSELYPILGRYYFRTGDLRKAYLLQDSARIYKDSITYRDNLDKLTTIGYKVDIAKRQAELERLVTEKKYIEFVRNVLLAGVLLLFFMGLVIINSLRMKHKIKHDHYRSEKRLAEIELTNYTQRLQEKNALIEKSGQEIKRLHASLSDVEKEQVDNEVLQQLYVSTILTDEEWEVFKAMFEQVHSGFLQRLKNKMPGLSPADTRFLVLSKLKLSNKEMAGILGVQADTIRTQKHRLRKKYDLPDDDNVTDLVDTI
jgi:tetratricopeptide (TPR) repeat protein/DNA-binding CsgD family transcriptional regulator